VPSIVEKESTKKLKYLNVPRTEKFNISEKISQVLRLALPDSGVIRCAMRKSTKVLQIMSARKRQSHQP